MASTGVCRSERRPQPMSSNAPQSTRKRLRSDHSIILLIIGSNTGPLLRLCILIRKRAAKPQRQAQALFGMFLAQSFTSSPHLSIFEPKNLASGPLDSEKSSPSESQAGPV